jgi:hypothetical protein
MNGNGCSLGECLRQWLSLWGQDSLWPTVKQALTDSRLLLLVDGLDEWTSLEAGRIAADMLQVFVRTTGAAVIATTRPFGGVMIHGSDWNVAEIAPLTEAQQTQLCWKWFSLGTVGTCRCRHSSHARGDIGTL